MKHFTLTIALVIPAFSYSKVINIPKDFPSIQQAINSAKEGDKILVAPGKYKERLVLKSGITVQSEGDDTPAEGEPPRLLRATRTTLEDPDGKGAGVTMAEDSILDGFTVTGVGNYDEASWQKHHKTQGEDQEMVHIGAEGTSGIEITRTCLVMNNIVHHIGYTGIAISGNGRKVEAKVTKNVCYRNMGGGIGIMRGANPTVSHNTCFENFYAGIGFTEATATVTHNQCYRNVRAGIGISEDSSPTVSNNHCHHNRRAGIGIRTGKATRPTVKDNLCEDNDMAGIGSKELAQPSLIGNTCRRNKLAGIGCSEDANATITGNTCTENGKSGIGLDGAKATLSGNTCEGNATAALGMQHGAEATATGNTFIAKSVVAIGIRNGSKLIAKDNKLSRKGGMPPLVAILENSTADMSGNTLTGGGVAGVLVKGTATIQGNTFLGNGPRKGGPPNFAAWVHPGSSISFIDNSVEGWRHAVLANAPKEAVANGNKISKFYDSAIVINNPENPAIAKGNIASSDDEKATVVKVSGKEGDVSDNSLVSRK
jgi:parallel beta-helix repeat protein